MKTMTSATVTTFVNHSAGRRIGANGHTPGLNSIHQAGSARNRSHNPRRSEAEASIPAFLPKPGRDGQTDQELQRLMAELKEITTLYNIGVTAASSLSLEDVIWRLYKESRRLLDTNNFAIVIYEAQTDYLNFALVFDRGRRIKSRAVRLAGSSGLAARVLTSRSALLAHDLLENSPPQTRSEQPVRSWLGVPIVNPLLPDVGVLGVLATWSYEPHAFTDHDLWLLSALGTQAAIAIRNACLHEGVLAERDRVLQAEQTARRALARDLHDGPTQLISALTMHLDFCRACLEKDPARLADEIPAMQTLARRAVHEIRTLLFELRPVILETQGLVAALEVFLEQRQQDLTTGPRLRLELGAGGGQLARQDPAVEAALFAIVQETVNNAIKHARARNIVVSLGETDHDICCAVKDDGLGFEVEQAIQSAARRGSLGLVNIRERAELIGGRLTLRSAPGAGTHTVVMVPKAEAERQKRRTATGPLSPLLRLMASANKALK